MARNSPAIFVLGIILLFKRNPDNADRVAEAGWLRVRRDGMHNRHNSGL